MHSDIPPDLLSSIDAYLHPSTASSTLSSASATTTPSSTVSSHSITSTDVSRAEPTSPPDSNPWNNMRDSSHHAIVASGVIGLIIALGLGIWFIKRRRQQAQAPSNSSQPGMLPLYNLQAPPGAATGRRAPGGDAPPSYEEVVPPHLRVATGPPRMLHAEAGEDSVIADGKTPLSEIPFEDVTLEPSSSSSSMSSANQAFQNVHHNGLGDTRGHTNS